MKLQQVKRTEKGKNPKRKSIVMSIRVTPTVSKWMKQRKVMPSKVFNLAIEELMEKNK